MCSVSCGSELREQSKQVCSAGSFKKNSVKVSSDSNRSVGYRSSDLGGICRLERLFFVSVLEICFIKASVVGSSPLDRYRGLQMM